VIDYLVPKHIDLQGKSVLVIGSEMPWLRLVCLSMGASKVTTLDDRKIESGHLKTFTPDGTLEHFDGILPHSF
jgi:hypothetical protein